MPLNLQWGVTMKHDDESFEDKKPDEEEILDFEFDELAETDTNVEGIGTSEEEILELVDVVERGTVDSGPGSETEEIERLLDEEYPLGEAEDEGVEVERVQAEAGGEESAYSEPMEPVEESELDLIEAEATRALPETEIKEEIGGEAQDLDLDLDSALEILEPAEETGLLDQAVETEISNAETATELEESDLLLEETKGILDQGLGEAGIRIPDEDLSAIQESREDLLELEAAEDESALKVETGISEEKVEEMIAHAVERAVQESLEGTVEKVARETMTDIEERLTEQAGISQERMEQLMARTVEKAVQESLVGTVERVARETMTDVAERLISEAIESLRESLASPSE